MHHQHVRRSPSRSPILHRGTSLPAVRLRPNSRHAVILACGRRTGLPDCQRRCCHHFQTSSLRGPAGPSNSHFKSLLFPSPLPVVIGPQKPLFRTGDVVGTRSLIVVERRGYENFPVRQFRGRCAVRSGTYCGKVRRKPFISRSTSASFDRKTK